MIDSNRFDEIGPTSLAVTLMEAAEIGHLEPLKTIINSNRFREISSDELGEVFAGAFYRGNFETCQAIIDSNRFNEIPLAVLEESLHIAIKCVAKGAPNAERILQAIINSRAVKAILRSEKVHEMTSESLGVALIATAKEGDGGAVTAITNSKKFNEIDLKYLRTALEEAEANSHEQIAASLKDLIDSSLIDSRRLDQLHISYMEEAFYKASEKWNRELLKDIVQSERFAQISPDYLTPALILAAGNGDLETLQAIINSSRFDQVHDHCKTMAFLKAQEKGHGHIASLLQGFDDDCQERKAKHPKT